MKYDSTSEILSGSAVSGVIFIKLYRLGYRNKLVNDSIAD